MKRLRSSLWIILGMIFIAFLFLTVHLFSGSGKTHIAVILPENSISNFRTFQEGIYDSAQDNDVMIYVIYTSELAKEELEKLLNEQKKHDCDGILLLNPEQFYTGSEADYESLMKKVKHPIFSITCDEAFFHGDYIDRLECVSDTAYEEIKENLQGTVFISADENKKLSIRLADKTKQYLESYGEIYKYDNSLNEQDKGAQTVIDCGGNLGADTLSQYGESIILCPSEADYTLIANGNADMIVTANEYSFGYRSIEYLKNHIDGKGTAFIPPEVSIITAYNLFNPAHDALIFE